MQIVRCDRSGKSDYYEIVKTSTRIGDQMSKNVLETNNGMQFQIRKLNNCIIEGCKSKLLAYANMAGRVVFICEGHSRLDAQLCKLIEKKKTSVIEVDIRSTEDELGW